MKTLRLAMKNWISFTKSKITWRFGSYLAGREPILLPRFAQNRKSFINLLYKLTHNRKDKFIAFLYF